MSPEHHETPNISPGAVLESPARGCGVNEFNKICIDCMYDKTGRSDG